MKMKFYCSYLIVALCVQYWIGVYTFFDCEEMLGGEAGFHSSNRWRCLMGQDTPLGWIYVGGVNSETAHRQMWVLPRAGHTPARGWTL